MKNVMIDYMDQIASLKQYESDKNYIKKITCKMHHELYILKKYDVIKNDQYINLRNELYKMYKKTMED